MITRAVPLHRFMEKDFAPLNEARALNIVLAQHLADTIHFVLKL